jgi:hypothetical protein
MRQVRRRAIGDATATRDRSEAAIASKLSKAINDLADYEGSRYAEISIPGDEIKSRTLVVVVSSEGTAAQQEVMRQIVELGRQRGITVNFESYPRVTP